MDLSVVTSATICLSKTTICSGFYFFIGIPDSFAVNSHAPPLVQEIPVRPIWKKRLRDLSGTSSF